MRLARPLLPALLIALGIAPAAQAAPPPLAVLGFQPVVGGSIVVERTAGEFGGDPEGWRMNMDVYLENNGPGDLTLTDVVVAYDGGSDPADIVLDAATYNANTGRWILADIPAFGLTGNVVDGGEDFRVANVPEERVNPFPVPDTVTVDLFFDGFTDPITVSGPLAEYVNPSPLGSYAFPSGAKDLPAGQYWYHGRSHTFASGHRAAINQRFAEDWGIARWDGSGWNNLVPGGDPTVNADYLIWGKPLYAVADGQVVRCANGFPENPTAGTKQPGVTSDPPTIPPGGNHIWLRHAPGEWVLYAHMMEGTLREDLCPDDPGAGEHDVVDGPMVSAGEFLGLVGNTGNSTAPHLHIHTQTPGFEGLPHYYHNVRAFEEDFFDPNNDPSPPWNLVTHAAISSHDAEPAFGMFVEPLPRANVGVEKGTLPAPAIAGTQVTTTVEVTNQGPDAASNVQVTDSLPEGFSYDTDTGGCVEGPADVLTCSIGAMAQQASDGTPDVETFTITSDIAPDLVFDNGGPVMAENGVEVMHTDFDDSAADDAMLEIIEVLAQADLSVVSFAITEAPSDALIGEDAAGVAEIVVTSDGPSSPMHATLDIVGSTGGADVIPDEPTVSVPALEDGEVRAIEIPFTISCVEPGEQTIDLTGTISPALPDDTDPNPANDTGQTPPLTVECVTPVQINIRPGGDPNSIHPDRGTISLAVLTTEAGEYGLPIAFDAATIDPLSVRFGDPDMVWMQTGGAPERHGRGHLEDAYEMDEATMDGDTDMVLHARAAQTGLTTASTEACVRGLYASGGDTFSFFGCDGVRIVPGAT